MTRSIKIINLGDIITPNFSDTLTAFTQRFSEKNPGLELSSIEHTLCQIIPKLKSSIDTFNRGECNEDDFTTEMLSILQKETGTLLSAEEFHHAWSAMYPEFTAYQTFLEQAIGYHKQANQEIILISATNSHAISQLISQLNSHNISYRLDDKGALREIDTIPLHTSYSTKQTKSELLNSIIADINKSLKPSHVVSRLFSRSSFRKKRADISYIRCTNTITDPVLKVELDQQNAELAETLKKLHVKTVIWNKHLGESLANILQGVQETLDQIRPSVAMLSH